MSRVEVTRRMGDVDLTPEELKQFNRIAKAEHVEGGRRAAREWAHVAGILPRQKRRR